MQPKPPSFAFWLMIALFVLTAAALWGRHPELASVLSVPLFLVFCFVLVRGAFRMIARWLGWL